MGYRPHICEKHEIRYFDATPNFNHRTEELERWFNDKAGVEVYHDDVNDDWEFDKSQLREIPESAYENLDDYPNLGADDLRNLVKSLIDAPTGEWAFMDWF